MIRPALVRPARQRVTRSRRGFTLVSMMVAMVLLMVGLTALGGANASTVKLQTLAQNRTNAIALARSHVETIRARDPWLVTSEPTVRLNADGVVSGSGAYRRTVSVRNVRLNLIEVEVRVDFPRGNRPILLTTSLFRGNGLSGAS